MKEAGKNLEIEALRGVAIIITIAAHLRLLFPWSPGWFEAFATHFELGVGVDLFFCISGYVIARSTMQSLAKKGHKNFKSVAIPFWIRRMWRLWPSAFLWIAIYISLAFFFNSSGAFGPALNTVNTSIAAAFQVANLYFPVCAHWGNCGTNAVYWSLSLEEQFYLLFPFLVFFLNRRKLVTLFVILIAVQFFVPRPTASLLWSIRTDAIACGILIALLTSAEKKLPMERVLSTAWFRWLLFALLVYALMKAQRALPFIAPGITAIISAVLVLVASKSRDLLVSSGPLRSMLVYVGGRSYAIYLIHEAAFLSTREIWYRVYPDAELNTSLTLPFTVIAALIIFASAEVNYRLIENPLRKLGRRMAERYLNNHPARSGIPAFKPTGLG
ncbi:acyltransferase family protein [Brucella anthropi]|uniref:acyltransferase family protein n=1 Tax=Brucella anthropi TaxID=529 RepID=UPI002449DD8B|nr:acyltransferase [Brucella anthropi]MDH0368996.1 acyltransferase [Brucella anthropi]